MNYTEALEYLKGLELFGIKLGLEQVSELLQSVGNPQNRIKFIHVAGTNGKGSVCAMLYNALQSVGFNTGLYTSPHLVSPRERFRFNGKGITEDEFASITEKLVPCAEKMKEQGRCPTYFEFTTAIVALFFKNKNANFAVWETGMGGRLDATNIVQPELSVITSISLDHEQYLGNSIEKIAFEKAGIIKENIPVFCGNLPLTAIEVIHKIAKEKNAPVFCSKDINLDWQEETDGQAVCILPCDKRIILPLNGTVQKDNFALAYMILNFLAKKYQFNLKIAVKGMEKTKWPARFQILPDGKILDGGHNPEAIYHLVETVRKFYPEQKFQIIYGALADKNAEDILICLNKIASKFIFVPVKGCRKSYSLDELQKLAERVICDENKILFANFAKEALEMAGTEKTLICGSLYLAGEVLSLYFNENEIIDI